VYTTVYEMSAAPEYAFWHCALFVLLGLGALRIAPRSKRPRFSRVWGGAALLLGGIGLVAVSARHVATYWAYRQDRAEVVEGTVRVVSRQPHGGHAPGDLVEVGGRRIEVDHFSSGPGYHQTLAYGGVLVDGARARLLLYHDRILRLEVQR
jgi:hypothetical protein